MEGPSCLQCGSPLDQDFGIVTCANCGAVMMIDMNGNPAPLEESAPASEPIDPTNENPVGEPEPPLAEDSYQPLEEPSVREPDEPNPEPEAAATDNWFDQNLHQDEPTSAPELKPESDRGLSEIADFGNQDTEVAGLRFDVTISGIDRSDLRAEVLSVLSDPRLYLNVRELGSGIDKGVLSIPALNAARASLIVSRLQHLDVQISWRQGLYEV